MGYGHHRICHRASGNPAVSSPPDPVPQKGGSGVQSGCHEPNHQPIRQPGFGILTHVGRKSGRLYRTPVNVFRAPDEPRIASSRARVPQIGSISDSDGAYAGFRSTIRDSSKLPPQAPWSHDPDSRGMRARPLSDRFRIAYRCDRGADVCTPFLFRVHWF
jgi:hypothetical protein